MDINESNLINTMYALIAERNQYENHLYDYLSSDTILDFQVNEVNEVNEIPPSFWDPVKVTLKNLDPFESIEELLECTICTDQCNHFKKVGCCKNLICNDCAKNWFLKESVYCPYCKADQRVQ